jgi:hypothetical protein
MPHQDNGFVWRIHRFCINSGTWLCRNVPSENETIDRENILLMSPLQHRAVCQL